MISRIVKLSLLVAVFGLVVACTDDHHHGSDVDCSKDQHGNVHCDSDRHHHHNTKANCSKDFHGNVHCSTY